MARHQAPENPGTLRLTPGGLLRPVLDRRRQAQGRDAHDVQGREGGRGPQARDRRARRAPSRERAHRRHPEHDPRGRRKADARASASSRSSSERIATGKEPGLATRTPRGARASRSPSSRRTGPRASSPRSTPTTCRSRGRATTTRGCSRGSARCACRTARPSAIAPSPTSRLDDCDHVMTALPKTAEAPASRRQYAPGAPQAARLRRLSAAPAPGAPDPEGLAPEGGERQGEGVDLPERGLGPDAVPRGAARSAGSSTACSCAKACASARRSASTWPDLDLERGVIRLDANKTDDPRRGPSART